MPASDQQILNEAKDSLHRILQADTSSWSEFDRQQNLLEIDKLEGLISRYEKRIAQAGGRRILSPIRRVNL